MSSEWQLVRLKDVTTILGDGLHGTPEYDDAGDYYFINGNNLAEGSILLTEKTRRVSEDEYLKHRKNLNDRTILVSINGTLGNVALYRGEKVILGKSACYFNVRDDVNKEFVRHVVSGPIFQDYIHTQATGSTIKNVSLKLMRDFTFKLPPLELQNRIAVVLSALDDRIALLRETNVTLEAIAQALFKSWFVDFDPVHANAARAAAEEQQAGATPAASQTDTSADPQAQRAPLPPDLAALFPDTFEDTELGPVPKGWRVGSILDIATLLSGGTPKTDQPEYWGGDISWASAKDVSQSPGSVLIETERTITLEGVERSATRMIPALASVVVARGATTGRMVLFGKEMAMNQTCYALVSKTGTPVALYCLLRREMDALVNAAHGSVFDTITTSTFTQSKVLQPSESVLSHFEKTVQPLFQQIIESTKSIDMLATLRDTLLPRLISGQLRLPEAELAIEKVI